MSETERRVDEHTSVYGPGVTEARAAEVALLMRLAGRLMEVYARDAQPHECVIVGRVMWVADVAVGLGMRQLVSLDHHSLGVALALLAIVDREKLGARLVSLGREGDAAKVIAGPPDLPTPGPDPRARLLVVFADEACLSVTWSQGWRPSGAEV